MAVTTTSERSVFSPAQRAGRDQPHPRDDLMRGDPVVQLQDEGRWFIGMGGDQREQSPLNLGRRAGCCGMKDYLIH